VQRFKWRTLPSWTRCLVIGLVVLAAGFLGYYCIFWLREYLLVPDVTQLRILAHDWQEIRFETNISGEWSGADHATITDLTGGGILGGKTQYISSGVTGAKFEPPPARFKGAIKVTVEDVEVTVIEVQDWSWYVDFDTNARQYYVKLWKAEEPFTYCDYSPPFEEIPDPLTDHIYYQSEQPETLIMISAAIDHSKWSPRLGILANEPTPFGWNMRRGCQVSIRRLFDSRSSSQNGLAISEHCPDARSFGRPSDQTMDDETRLQYLAYATPFGHTLLLLPRSFLVQADGLGNIPDSGEEYLVLVQGVKSAVRLTAQPEDLDFNFVAYLLSTYYNLDQPLAEIEPTTREVTLVGPVGKIALGIETTMTDELSEMLLEFSDWPRFTWHNQVVTREDGEDRLQQFLSGTGIATSVVVNGEEIVATHWNSLSPEMRGAIVGGIIGALGSIGLTIWQTRRRPIAPAVQVETPTPAVSVTTVPAEPGQPLVLSGRELLITFGLIGVLVWLWIRTRK